MRHVTPVVHRVLEGSGSFVRQGLRSTGDSTGALDVDGEDKHIKKDLGVVLCQALAWRQSQFSRCSIEFTFGLTPSLLKSCWFGCL